MTVVFWLCVGMQQRDGSVTLQWVKTIVRENEQPRSEFVTIQGPLWHELYLTRLNGNSDHDI